jgi:hypothetical protein
MGAVCDRINGYRCKGGFCSLVPAHIALFECPPGKGSFCLQPTMDDTGACGALSAAAVRLHIPIPPSDDTRPPFVWSASIPGGYFRSPPLVVRLTIVTKTHSLVLVECHPSLRIAGCSLLLSKAHDVLRPTPPVVTARKMTPAVPPLPPDGYRHPGLKADLSDGVRNWRNSFPTEKRIDHVSQLIADFTANEQCSEIATLYHVLVPVNWNVAVDQAHTARWGWASNDIFGRKPCGGSQLKEPDSQHCSYPLLRRSPRSKSTMTAGIVSLFHSSWSARSATCKAVCLPFASG